MTHNATRLAHRGRGGFGGLVNPPICRGSTILSPDFDSFVSGAKPHGYGRLGSPTNDALAEVLLDLEGPSAAGIVLTSSGLSAIMTAMR
jgi:cystathionine beta-lyase